MNRPTSSSHAGPCGTGKSHLAQALGHCAVRQGHDVIFLTQTQLLGSLQHAKAMGTYERRFQALAKVPLLIIDDLGLKQLRSPQDEDLHDLIVERHEQAATVVTSNLVFSEWGEAFPNRLLGAATIDRLRHGAYQLILEGKSYRSPKICPQSMKNQASKTVKTQGNQPMSGVENGPLLVAPLSRTSAAPLGRSVTTAK